MGAPPAASLLLIHEEKCGQPYEAKTYVSIRKNVVIEGEQARSAITRTPEAPAWSECDTDADPVIVEGQKQGLEKFPARLQRYHRGHGRAEEMAAFLQELAGGPGFLEARDVRRRASKLRLCGGYLQFQHYFTIDQVRLSGGMFCQQDKLCPLCALRRGAKLLRKYTEKCLAVLQSNPQLSPYMVTQTVKDGAVLRERFGHLVTSSRALRERARDYRRGERPGRKRGPWTEAVLAEGAVESIEIKRGSGSGEWHPHNHSVWLCPRSPDQQLLRQEWREITGDSHMVHVQPFHYIRDGKPATPENISRDLCEVFKYAIKLQELTLADNWEAFRDLQGRHMVLPRGLLYGVPEPTDCLDEPASDEDLPFVEWLYRYTKSGYQLEHFA